MKVAELQHSLGHIVAFAKSAGASDKVTAELDRALQCFDPFKEKTLTEFSDFLRRADEFDRTGALQPPARKAAKPRTPKAAALTADAAAQIFTSLHDRATDPTLTYEEIDAALAPLDKLKIPQLLEVAAKVNVTVPSKPKKEIVRELTSRIKELKASHERTQFRFGETA